MVSWRVESNCFSDLTYRKIADDQCISILTRYIPLFQNVGIRLDLIKQQFCRKNHTECSDFLEKWYYDLKRENALNKAIENTLDNAFAKIQDKRKIAFYLQLIEKADQFPLVMTMLGKWNIENAKPIIINRLEIDRIKTNAIRALGYYKDKSTVPLIEKYVDSEYSGVRKEEKKFCQYFYNRKSHTAPPCFSHRSMAEWRQHIKPTGGQYESRAICYGPRRQHRQDPSGLSRRSADGVPPTGLHGAERRRHPLPAGAGRL